VPVERVTAFIEGHEPISAEIALQLAQLFDRSARMFQR
jgi:plasmid maintenance system antidote protein VapI